MNKKRDKLLFVLSILLVISLIGVSCKENDVESNRPGPGLVFEIVEGIDTWDFESSYLSDIRHSSDNHQNWYRTSNSKHGGKYSYRSGHISHNQKSCFEISGSYSRYSFYYRTSSKSQIDFLKLYIDTKPVFSQSGTNDWQHYSGTAASSYDIIKWCYQKNGDTSDGSDAVWIDDIELDN